MGSLPAASAPDLGWPDPTRSGGPGGTSTFFLKKVRNMLMSHPHPAMSSLTTSNTAAILYGPRDIRIEDRTIWAPDAAHVQIQVASTGLCGSDLHYYSAGRNGDFAVRAPLVLGHESAGTITALGAGVAVSHPHLRVGQRVAIEAGISCRNCAYCEKGRYNLCKGMRFCSSAARFPHVDGTLQERMNHPAFVVHPYVFLAPVQSRS